MAMVCISGAGECDGCMKCQGPSQEPVAGICGWCGEPVFTTEARYEFPDGNVTHDDCVLDFINKHYRKMGG